MISSAKGTRYVINELCFQINLSDVPCRNVQKVAHRNILVFNTYICTYLDKTNIVKISRHTYNYLISCSHYRSIMMENEFRRAKSKLKCFCVLNQARHFILFNSVMYSIFIIICRLVPRADDQDLNSTQLLLHPKRKKLPSSVSFKNRNLGQIVTSGDWCH